MSSCLRLVQRLRTTFVRQHWRCLRREIEMTVFHILLHAHMRAQIQRRSELEASVINSFPLYIVPIRRQVFMLWGATRTIPLHKR